MASLTQAKVAAIVAAEAEYARRNESSDGVLTCSVIANRLADVLADGNPRFNRERFLRACGETTVEPDDDQQ